MRRSKLSTVLVDAPAEVFEKEVDFWSGALGRAPQGDDDDPEYRDYGEPVPGVQFMVQEVGAPGSISISRPTTSTPRSGGWRRWAPRGLSRTRRGESCATRGLLFCVVRVQTGDNFTSLATRWPDWE